MILQFDGVDNNCNDLSDLEELVSAAYFFNEDFLDLTGKNDLDVASRCGSVDFWTETENDITYANFRISSDHYYDNNDGYLINLSPENIPVGNTSKSIIARIFIPEGSLCLETDCAIGGFGYWDPDHLESSLDNSFLIRSYITGFINKKVKFVLSKFSISGDWATSIEINANEIVEKDLLIVASYDSNLSRARFFVRGQEIEESDMNDDIVFDTNPERIVIGEEIDGENDFLEKHFDGLINDFAIINKALTEDEVNTIHTQGLEALLSNN